VFHPKLIGLAHRSIPAQLAHLNLSPFVIGFKTDGNENPLPVASLPSSGHLTGPIKGRSTPTAPPSFHPCYCYCSSLPTTPCHRVPPPPECSSPSPTRQYPSSAHSSHRYGSVSSPLHFEASTASFGPSHHRQARAKANPQPFPCRSPPWTAVGHRSMDRAPSS
jgi:hypothetical protein